MDLRVETGKLVCLDYILSLPDGTRIDSTEGSGVWTYVHGHTRVPPGFAMGVEGLGVGEHVRLALAPEEAFGLVDPDAFQEVAKELVPPAALHVDFRGELPGPDGSVIPFRIHAIQEDTVMMDLNHPLAGEHVIFDVTIRHIQD